MHAPNGKSGGPMTTHPMHLFDPDKAGPMGKPARAIRLSSTKQNDVFLSALLETGATTTVRRSPLQWVAATGLHIVILAALIRAPASVVESPRVRGCPGNAVEIADVLTGLFNDLGAVVVPSSLVSGDYSAWLE